MAKRLPSDLYYDVDKVQTIVDELYPALHQLHNSLREAGFEMGEPLPPPNEPPTLETYGRAICGHAKMMDAIGRALIRMAKSGGKQPG